MSQGEVADDEATRRQWVLVGGLSVLGAVGVAWGAARDDPILIALWVAYLLLAALFAYRVYR